MALFAAKPTSHKDSNIESLMTDKLTTDQSAKCVKLSWASRFVTWINGFPTWIRRNVRKRYGVFMMLTLAFWSLAGLNPAAESLLKNGLLIDSYLQLWFLTIVNVVAVFFCVSVNRVLNDRFPGLVWSFLFGDGSRPWSVVLFLIVSLVSVFTPAILAMCFASEYPTTSKDHFIFASIAITTGLLLGLFFLWAIGFLKTFLTGSDHDTTNFFPFESKARKGWSKLTALQDRLVSSTQWLGMERVDWQLLFYLALLAAFHYGFTFWLRDSKIWLTSAPSMVVVLIWIAGMALTGAANLLDKVRLPVLLVLLAVVSLIHAFGGSTRNLTTAKDDSKNKFVSKIADVQRLENNLLESGSTVAAKRVALIETETAELEETAWNAIVKRMARLDEQPNYRNQPIPSAKSKTLVVVTCPGGGIHAAAWSACVLEKISQEYVDFADSVCVISGVSGGSVGTLCFVASQYEDELIGRKEVKYGAAPPSTEEVHDRLKETAPALERATRSSLEEIAYGITTDDLYGAFLPFLPRRDRGQRLEDGLSERLPENIRTLTLGQWGDRAVAGSVPIVIFNSTDAVSGRRVLFDTIPTPRRSSSVGLKSRPLNYRELLLVESDGQAFDVYPATAARTSATFPYVSPFTRPDMASPFGQSVAICDGGYVDNEGIVSAVNWIEFLLKRWSESEKGKQPFDRILLLRIEPAAIVDTNEPADSGGLFGYLRWLTGPAETMVSVRSASQAERGNLESDLAKLVLESPIETSGSSSTADAETSQNTSRAALKLDQRLSDETQETAIKLRTNSKQENRDIWDKKVKAFMQRKEKEKLSPKEATPPRMQAIYNPPTTVEGESDSEMLPVIVRTIAFKNSDQKIPLNWKLSNKQKVWYPLSWEECSKSGTQLRDTLNQYFTPAIGDADED